MTHPPTELQAKGFEKDTRLVDPQRELEPVPTHGPRASPLQMICVKKRLGNWKEIGTKAKLGSASAVAGVLGQGNKCDGTLFFSNKMKLKCSSLKSSSFTISG